MSQKSKFKELIAQSILIMYDVDDQKCNLKYGSNKYLSLRTEQKICLWIFCFCFLLYVFLPKPGSLVLFICQKRWNIITKKIFKILLLRKNNAAIRQFEIFLSPDQLNYNLFPSIYFKKSLALTYRNHH